jgi:hypothetical protein
MDILSEYVTDKLVATFEPFSRIQPTNLELLYQAMSVSDNLLQRPVHTLSKHSVPINELHETYRCLSQEVCVITRGCGEVPHTIGRRKTDPG